jgi:hypothetical protein
VKHIVIPGVRRKLHTNATRRYLVVSTYDGRPKVEASCPDELSAQRLLRRYRNEFGPGAQLLVIDQEEE